MESKLMDLSWSLGVLGLVILVSTATSVVAMTCKETMVALIPCSPFLTSPVVTSPNLACCKALANVSAAANTTHLRRELCECFKKNCQAYGIIPAKAMQLPGLCGVRLLVPISPSADCKNIR